MTNFKWVFGLMECYVDVDGLTDVVYTVNWRYQATRENEGKEYFAEVYGTTGVVFLILKHLFLMIKSQKK